MKAESSGDAAAAVVTRANGQHASSGKVKSAILKKMIALAILLTVALVASTKLLGPIIQNGQEQYLIYLQVGEVAIAGFFVIDIVGSASYKLVAMHSEQAARAVLSLNRIVGAMVVIAIITSYLSKDPIIAVSVSTISGLVIGFASQNIIGNLIAGMYLIIARPFRIGDAIRVFDSSGTVSGIELLYCRILLENGDVMLAPNSALVTTSIVIKGNAGPAASSE